MTNVIYKTGNVFSTNFKAVSYGVNTYGLMEFCIVAEVEKHCPEISQPHKKSRFNGSLKLGEMLPIYSKINNLWVFKMVVQDKSENNARLEWLATSVDKAFNFCQENNLEGFALPRAGSGIDGLGWTAVDTVLNLLAEEHPEVTLEIWLPPEA